MPHDAKVEYNTSVGRIAFFILSEFSRIVNKIMKALRQGFKWPLKLIGNFWVHNASYLPVAIIC